MDPPGLTVGQPPNTRPACGPQSIHGRRPGPSAEEVEDAVRRLVTEMMDGVGIDNSSFVGRERVRANLAFLQMLREQHEERGREFRRGLFQNGGNLVALTLMSALLTACGWLVGHGFVLK